jgi:endonuclease/exonuclease/phosphatase family metal-dependent hydrolase
MVAWLGLAGCGGVEGGSPLDAANPADGTGADASSETQVPAPLEMTVMTFNVMCSFCDPSYDPWDRRMDYQADIIERHKPDLIGLQEFVFAEEVVEYLTLNPDYEAIYYVSTDPESVLPAYPDQTILYRKDRFREIERGFFWLSPTPDEPFTTGFKEDGGQLWRLVGWVLFEQQSDGRRFYFANTHFDANHPSQEKSVPLVYDRFSSKVSELPLIFTGDFNLEPGEEGFIQLVEGVEGHDWHFVAAYNIAKERLVVSDLDPTSLNDRGRGIDLVLLAGGEFECNYWKVDYMTYGDRNLYPSDHFAISAQIVVK